METYRLEDTTLAGLPVLTIAPEGGTGRRPAVLYVHGFTLDRRAGVELGYQLAERGLFVISLDAAMHGARSRPPLNDGPQPPEPGRSPEGSGLSRYLWMMRIVERTAQDVGRLLEALEGDARGRGPAGDGRRVHGRVHRLRVRCPLPANPRPGCPNQLSTCVALGGPAGRGPRRSPLCRAELTGTPPRQTPTLSARWTPSRRWENATPRARCCCSAAGVDLDAPRFYSLQFYKEMQPLYRQHGPPPDPVRRRRSRGFHPPCGEKRWSGLRGTWPEQTVSFFTPERVFRALPIPYLPPLASPMGVAPLTYREGGKRVPWWGLGDG